MKLILFVAAILLSVNASAGIVRCHLDDETTDNDASCRVKATDGLGRWSCDGTFSTGTVRMWVADEDDSARPSTLVFIEDPNDAGMAAEDVTPFDYKVDTWLELRISGEDASDEIDCMIQTK